MRLIDADELIKNLHIEDGGTILIALQTNSLYKVIQEQPTAYDIDKVVEELEEMKSIDGSMKTKLCIKFDEMTVNRAIEIVKQGVR